MPPSNRYNPTKKPSHTADRGRTAKGASSRHKEHREAQGTNPQLNQQQTREIKTKFAKWAKGKFRTPEDFIAEMMEIPMLEDSRRQTVARKTYPSQQPTRLGLLIQLLAISSVLPKENVGFLGEQISGSDSAANGLVEMFNASPLREAPFAQELLKEVLLVGDVPDPSLLQQDLNQAVAVAQNHLAKEAPASKAGKDATPPSNLGREKRSKGGESTPQQGESTPDSTTVTTTNTTTNTKTGTITRTTTATTTNTTTGTTTVATTVTTTNTTTGTTTRTTTATTTDTTTDTTTITAKTSTTENSDSTTVEIVVNDKTGKANITTIAGSTGGAGALILCALLAFYKSRRSSQVHVLGEETLGMIEQSFLQRLEFAILRLEDATAIEDNFSDDRGGAIVKFLNKCIEEDVYHEVASGYGNEGFLEVLIKKHLLKITAVLANSYLEKTPGVNSIDDGNGKIITDLVKSIYQAIIAKLEQVNTTISIDQLLTMHSLDEAFKDLLPTNNTQEEIGAKIDAAIENLFSTSNTRTATFDAGAVYDEPSFTNAATTAASVDALYSQPNKERKNNAATPVVYEEVAKPNDGLYAAVTPPPNMRHNDHEAGAAEGIDNSYFPFDIFKSNFNADGDLSDDYFVFAIYAVQFISDQSELASDECDDEYESDEASQNNPNNSAKVHLLQEWLRKFKDLKLHDKLSEFLASNSQRDEVRIEGRPSIVSQSLQGETINFDDALKAITLRNSQTILEYLDNLTIYARLDLSDGARKAIIGTKPEKTIYSAVSPAAAPRITSRQEYDKRKEFAKAGKFIKPDESVVDLKLALKLNDGTTTAAEEGEEETTTFKLPEGNTKASIAKVLGVNADFSLEEGNPINIIVDYANKTITFTASNPQTRRLSQSDATHHQSSVI